MKPRLEATFIAHLCEGEAKDVGVLLDPGGRHRFGNDDNSALDLPPIRN
jgi:hypothetical protein